MWSVREYRGWNPTSELVCDIPVDPILRKPTWKSTEKSWSRRHMKLRSPIEEIIGNTALIELDFPDWERRVYAKCEFQNPSGSIKDRFASQVLREAVQSGKVTSESRILECSSGNTGIALAMMGAAMGIGVTIVISAKASLERRKLLSRLGADIILLPDDLNYQDGIDLCRSMAEEDDRLFLPEQFENPLNTEDHRLGTGMEIVNQLPMPIDAFVSGYGTGGTLSGCSIAIKARHADARIIAIEPMGPSQSPELNECCFNIEGIAGCGFRPKLLEKAQVDATIRISAEEAFRMTQRLHRESGLLVGTSSGANVLGALLTARDLGGDAVVVTILCDRAERYFSTPLFRDTENIRWPRGGISHKP